MSIGSNEWLDRPVPPSINALAGQQRSAQSFTGSYERHAESETPATLIEGLSDPIEGYVAARFLGDAGATDAVPELMRYLDSPDAQMRASVLRSLGRLGASVALPQIETAVGGDEAALVPNAGRRSSGRADATRSGASSAPSGPQRPRLAGALCRRLRTRTNRTPLRPRCAPSEQAGRGPLAARRLPQSGASHTASGLTAIGQGRGGSPGPVFGNDP